MPTRFNVDWFDRKNDYSTRPDNSRQRPNYLLEADGLSQPMDSRKLPALSAVQDTLIDKKLHRFIKHTWPLVEPGARFLDNWHLEAIADHLQAVYSGEIKRLIINIPPRCGKSLLTSVFFPAWAWAQSPELKWIFCSHDQGLADDASLKMRRLLETQWYQQRYAPDPLWTPEASWLYAGVRLEKDQNAKRFYQTTAGGARLALTVGSGLTGKGADIILVDDPHNAKEALVSEAARRDVLLWWGSTLSTRLNPGSRWGAKIVIMQRLHENDLVGYLLAQRDRYFKALEEIKALGLPVDFQDTPELAVDPKDLDWEHLCLPAEYIPKHPHPSRTSLKFADPRVQAGELLWPNGLPRSAIAGKRIEMGDYAASGQLDQMPSPPGGGMLKREWFVQVEQKNWPQFFDELIQAWDLSYSDDPTSDFVVGFLQGRVGAKVYLIKRIRGQLSFINQLKAIEALSLAEPGASAKYIEKAANARAAQNTLCTSIPGIILVKATDSKAARAMAWSPFLQAGNVHVPVEAHWLEEFLTECEGFPKSKHDDQVDAAGLGILQLIESQKDVLEHDANRDSRTPWGE